MTPTPSGQHYAYRSGFLCHLEGGDEESPGQNNDQTQ